MHRAGCSGHTPNSKEGTVPRGRIFALSRDELVECVALPRAFRRGRLNRLSIPEKPLDILAQQRRPGGAGEGWDEDELYELCRGAFPYRDLAREEFDEVVQMLAEGFTTRRGRSAAHPRPPAVRPRRSHSP